MGIKDKFKKEVKGLKDYIVLVTVDAKNYQKSNLEILSLLVNEQNTPGVYVTLNKPFDVEELLTVLEKSLQKRAISGQSSRKCSG